MKAREPASCQPLPPEIVAAAAEAERRKEAAIERIAAKTGEIMFTEQQLRQMLPSAGKRLDAHLPYIAPAMAEGRIDTPRRIAAFLAQLAHESGEYRYMEELADGSAYEGRRDLGNVMPGDGVRFKGRGPIQITGRANYMVASQALKLPLVDEPELLTQPEYGTRSAVWFWNSRDLSLLADRDWFRLITRIINGGFNGLDDRVAYWRRNRAILGLPPVDLDHEMGSIMEFQSAHGLVADGIVGPKTFAALKAATAAKVAA